jgi:hypothetical protein
MNAPNLAMASLPWNVRTLSEQDADAIAGSSVCESGDYGQLLLTEDADGAVVGLAVGEAKLSLRVLPVLLLKLARRCLEASVQALDTSLGDLAAIRDLVLSDAAKAEMKADAEADALIEAMLAIEKDRQSAIAPGREAGAKEWAAAVEDLALACKMRPGVERHRELERLAPFVARARAVRAG